MNPCDSCRRSLCSHPEIEALAPFRAIHARWLLTGTAYRIFLEWKKRPSRLLHRVLVENPEFEHSDRLWTQFHGDLLIPIPQELGRSWRLHRAPAPSLAQRLSRQSGVPAVSALQPAGTAPQAPIARRQAALRSDQRWQRGPRWSVDHRTLEDVFAIQKRRRKTAGRLPRIILVDDLMTTGATLVSAAQTLQQWGYTEISAWVLGVRPSTVARSHQAPQACSRARLAP